MRKLRSIIEKVKSPCIPKKTKADVKDSKVHNMITVVEMFGRFFFNIK